jgi:basic membrane protein A
MTLINLSRRSVLKAGAAGLAAAALPMGLARAQSPIVLGAVYVGPRDDFGSMAPT